MNGIEERDADGPDVLKLSLPPAVTCSVVSGRIEREAIAAGTVGLHRCLRRRWCWCCRNSRGSRRRILDSGSSCGLCCKAGDGAWQKPVGGGHAIGIGNGSFL